MITNLIVLEEKKATTIVLFLKVAFLVFLCVEIYGEYIENREMQYATKPFLMPLLAAVYLLTAQKASKLYLSALFFNWMANLLFISSNLKSLIIASCFFLIYRSLILFKIFKDKRKLSVIPIVLGAIPFLFMFLSLINLVNENIHGGDFYVVVFQALLMTLLGGFSLANYVVFNSIKSKLLLISSLFFGINLFTLGVKFYYIDFLFLKSLSMIFFALGHITFYYFMILKEEN